MIENHGVVDKVHHLAVVVDDHHGLGRLIQGRPFQHVGVMGIGDNQQGAPGDQQHGVVRLKKQIAPAGLAVPLQQLGGQGGFPLGDDIGGFAHGADRGRHGHGRSQAVQIRVPVAHDQHVFRRLNQLREGGGHDAGAHLVRRSTPLEAPP